MKLHCLRSEPRWSRGQFRRWLRLEGCYINSVNEESEFNRICGNGCSAFVVGLYRLMILNKTGHNEPEKGDTPIIWWIIQV